MAEEKKVKVSEKVENIVSEVAKLSVLELSELVTALQEKLGVSAAMPVAAAQVAAPAEGGAPAADAGSANQTVIMTVSGANKIAVIKALREINQELGLKEAKDIADAPPKEILKDAPKEQAEEAKKKLEAAGAKVEMK